MDGNKLYPGLRQTFLIIAIVLGLQIGISIIVEIVGMVLGIQRLSAEPATLAIANLISFGAVIFWGVKKTGAPFQAVLPVLPIQPALLLPIILTALGMGILLSEMDNCFRFVFPPPDFITDFFSNLTSGNNFWAMFFCLVVVAPVTEELLFRGLILRGFLSRYSATKALLISAALFALIHMNPWQFISAATLGVVLGWWFLQTRNLVPCLIGHAINNTMAATCIYFPIKIPGFNEGEPMPVVFQPLWFDLFGAILAVLGLWMFKRMAKRPELPPIIMTAPVQTVGAASNGESNP